MVSFCRIDDREIRVREPIAEPDAVIIQDPTLLHQVDVFGGLRPEGYVLINTERTFDELGLTEFLSTFSRQRILTVPASEFAREHVGRPLPNAALLGGFAAISGLITLASVEAAIRQTFKGAVADGNVRGLGPGLRVRRRRDEGAGRCVGSWRAPGRSPRRSRCAGPR